MKLGVEQLTQCVAQCLRSRGADDETAVSVAESIVAAERDSALAHGLLRLPTYLSALSTRWVDGAAEMVVAPEAPGLLRVDAANGFAQAALLRASHAAIEMTRANGICSVAIRNSHHFGVLWPDVERFANVGLVCLAFVNSRSLMVAPGAKTMVLGTNPIAFAVPRVNAPPLVCDLASSAMSFGDVMLAARAGRAVQDFVGVNADGHPTNDPCQILNGGALLPFGGLKGFWIALLVEIMAAALTGGRFGFEEGLAHADGATTSKAGQMLILIDPSRTGGDDFGARLESLLQTIIAAGTDRLPGDRRYRARTAASSEGIEVPPEVWDLLQANGC